MHSVEITNKMQPCWLFLLSHTTMHGSMNIKFITHVLCAVTFFENHAIHEIMQENVVEPGRSQMTIWCMHIACWIPKATTTHSEYVILIGFPLQ